MKRISTSLICYAIFALSVAMAGGGSEKCSAAEIPMSVGAAFEQNLSALANVSVTWKLVRKSNSGLAELLDAINLSAAGAGGAFLREERASFKYSDGKSRVRFDYSMPILRPEAEAQLQGSIATVPATGELDEAKEHSGTSSPLNSIRVDAIQGYSDLATELSWDGVDVFYGSPPQLESVGALTIFPANMHFINFDTWKSDYWRQIGIYVPRLSKEFASGALMQSDILRGSASSVVESVGSKTADDGTACLAIVITKPKGRVEYVLDPKMQYALRQRIERDEKGNVLYKSTMAKFKECGDEPRVWLPMLCRVDYYAYPQSNMPAPPSNEVLYTEEYSLLDLLVGTEAAATLTPSSFTIAYQAGGTNVQDGRVTTDGKALQYTVPANPEDLENAIERAKHGKPYVPEDLRRSAWRYTLILFNVTVVAFLVIALWWKRRHA